VTCKDFLALLDDLIDDEVSPICAPSCKPIWAVADTASRPQYHPQDIEIYRSHEIYDLPTDLRERLHAAIMSRCKKGC